MAHAAVLYRIMINDTLQTQEINNGVLSSADYTVVNIETEALGNGT